MQSQSKIFAFLWVLLLMTTLTFTACAQNILSGPVVNPANGHTYYLLDTSTWKQAQAKALTLGGNLATINDATEENWIYASFSRFGGQARNLWIGLYDADPNVNSTDRSLRRQEFRWISGEPVTYANWSPVEPNNPITHDPTPPELYVHIWNPSDLYAGRWNNYADASTEFSLPLNGVVEVPTVSQSLLSLTLSPSTVHSFAPSTGTVTLGTPAASGGTTVTLTSPNPTLAHLPATVTVAAGAVSATFSITTGRVTVGTSLTLSATLGTVTKTATLTLLPGLPFDFNADGHNDLIFQNSTTGQIILWYMNGLNLLGGDLVSALPAPGWSAVGVADFNNDGHPDIVLQNTTSGQVVLWYFNGATQIGGEETSQIPAAGYKVVGTGDFNGDGHVDIVFQNPTTGVIAIWYMNGAKVIGGVQVQAVPNSAYHLAGVGDFNGDGQPDFLFQNVTSGALVVWFLHGATYFDGGALSQSPVAGWVVKGVADYNSDGTPDIVFQNSTTNQTILWFTSGLNVTGGNLTPTQPQSPYKIVGPH